MNHRKLTRNHVSSLACIAMSMPMSVPGRTYRNLRRAGAVTGARVDVVRARHGDGTELAAGRVELTMRGRAMLAAFNVAGLPAVRKGIR